MEVIQLGPQRVEFDRESTLALYERMQPGAEECSCEGCRTFMLRRSKAFPDPFQKLLNTLGADVAKEWEVFEIGPNGNGKTLYGGWFIFLGAIIDGFDHRPQWDGTSFQCWFTQDFPSTQLLTPERTCAVEFITSI